MAEGLIGSGLVRDGSDSRNANQQQDPPRGEPVSFRALPLLQSQGPKWVERSPTMVKCLA